VEGKKNEVEDGGDSEERNGDRKEGVNRI